MLLSSTSKIILNKMSEEFGEFLIFIFIIIVVTSFWNNMKSEVASTSGTSYTAKANVQSVKTIYHKIYRNNGNGTATVYYVK
jgi:hypothetical protein